MPVVSYLNPIPYVRGLRDYNDAFEKNKGKKEIVDILIKYTRIKNRKVYENVVPVGLSPNGSLNIKSLRNDAKWYHQRGYLKQQPDIDTIVDTQYIEYAKQKLVSYE